MSQDAIDTAADLDLSVSAVVRAAIDKAGLSDFGQGNLSVADDFEQALEREAFVEPLRVLLDSLAREAQLHSLGRTGQFERIRDLLVNRLRIEALLRRYPEIHDEPLEPPIVIAGLMRTGTTMLHRLLACDSAFYAPLWYEVRYPAPLAEDSSGAPILGDDDPRIALAKQEVAAMLEANPALASIHPLDAVAADEEILLLEQAFYSTVPESFAHLPSYAKWLDNHSNRPAYVYLRKLLQCLQWQKKQRGEQAGRWLLKTPHHLHHLDILLEVFPGATVIQTHRDPLQTIPSLCSMNYELAVMGSDSVDAHILGQHWSEKFARSLNAAIDVRARYPAQFVDVDYRDTVAKPLEVAAAIYNAIGHELTPATRQAMQHWLEANRRDDRAVHQYSLQQFGFSEASIRQQYARYIDCFLNSASN